MAYNYFPQNYQTPLYYPTQSIPTQQTAGGNASALIWVQGEAGAKSYMVAPNQTVVLWDSEQDAIYIKSADASGMPSIKTLDYTVRGGTQQKAEFSDLSGFATKDEVSALQKEINALKAKFDVRKDGRK